MPTIDGFFKKVHKVSEVLSVFFLAGMVVMVTVVVIGRYVFAYTPSWGEEIALFCMVWFSLMSAAMGIFENRHIRVTIIHYFLPKKAVAVLDLLVLLLLLGILGFLIIKGFGLLEVTRNSLMGGSQISFMYLYAAVPVSAIFMTIATISKIRSR